MMRPVLPVVLCCLAVCSCDKARDMAKMAKHAVEEQVERVSSGEFSSEPPVDQELKSLVDETPEGIVFRKDLPFPSHVKVTVHSERKFKGRHFQSALLGSGSDQIDGTFLYERELERIGLAATVKLTKSTFTDTPTEEEAPPPEQGKTIMPPASLKMERKDGKWLPVMDGQALDFSMAAEVTGGEFADVLAEEGLLPRPLWFGKQRMKPGDVITLTGANLGVLMPPGTAGQIEMKLESTGSVGGHPCGIFTINGDVTLPNSRRFEGGSGNEQFSIEGGKLWVSMLYPLVLREEIKGIVSSKSGKVGGNFKQSQGSVEITLKRDWTAVSAKSK